MTAASNDVDIAAAALAGLADLRPVIRRQRTELAANQDRRTDLTRSRDAAIWRLYHDHGMSAPDISRRLTEALQHQGLTAEQIEDVGVSHDTVRRVAGTRQEPTPRPPEAS